MTIDGTQQHQNTCNDKTVTMPTLTKDSAAASLQTQHGEETDFKTWSEGADLDDSEVHSDESAAGSNTQSDNSNDLFTGNDNDKDDDGDYIVTESQQKEEEDVEFDITDYVDEVQMKREEDAQEKEQELREKSKAQEKKGQQKTKKQSTLTVNAKASSAHKRCTDDRSPQSQSAGAASKKAHVSKGPKSANTATIYKEVNTHSQNRRQCNRLKEASAATPERNNRWRYTYKTRATFRIRIPSVDKPDTALHAILKEFVQELRRVDPSAALLPWKNSDVRVKPIKKPDEVPTSVTQLRKYLKKFYLGKGNREITIYPGIHIGHQEAFNELRTGLQDWLEMGAHALFYMMLQAEDSTKIGWLLYTTREMDAGAMVDEIADLVGVTVGLRWKVIDIGVKGKIPEAQKVQALIVEVETCYRWEAQQQLTQYFGRARKDICEYPNGVRVRFVKNRKDALNTTEKGKLDRLRARQQLFLSTIQTHETWDILQLDYCSTPGSPTLRQMIMGLTVGEQDTPIFHSVDLDWQGVGYVFQYSPELKVQAECTIHTLLPLLKYHYPTSSIEGNFTQQVIRRCQNMEFDEESGMVIDPTLEQSMKYVEEVALPGFSLDMSAITNAEADSRPTQRTGFPSASDSVSTLDKDAVKRNSGRLSAAPSAQIVSTTVSRQDDSSILSSTSAITTETIQTIETQLQKLQTHVSNTDRKFDEIMMMLRQGNGLPTSGASQRTEMQSGTSSDPVTLDAGGDPESSSGGVP